MNAYLRMMRMLRPYTVHLMVAVVFMILFSLTETGGKEGIPLMTIPAS